MSKGKLQKERNKWNEYIGLEERAKRHLWGEFTLTKIDKRLSSAWQPQIKQNRLTVQIQL